MSDRRWYKEMKYHDNKTFVFLLLSNQTMEAQYVMCTDKLPSYA